MNIDNDEPNYNACCRHQDTEVYGAYGQRGCEDCVHTAKLFAAQRQALRDEVVAAIGENVTTHRSSCADGDMFTECDCGLGRMNQERDRIRTAISTIFEEKG